MVTVVPQTTRRPRIREYRWENPPTGAVYLRRDTSAGPEDERRGPRSLLTLDEAAVVLERSPAEVVQAIRAGFLRAQRRGSRVLVTPRSCRDFLDEEAEDRAIARARRREPTIPALIRSRPR